MKISEVKVTKVTTHAIEEASRKCRVNPKVAEEWIRNKIKAAKFISEVLNDDGSPGRLYAIERICFILSVNEDVVITVYPRHTANSDFRRKLNEIADRELAKIDRRVKAIERKVTIAKAEMAIERAKCEWKMAVTPSARVIAVNQARMAAIDEEIVKMDEQLMAVRKERSTFAKGLAILS